MGHNSVIQRCSQPLLSTLPVLLVLSLPICCAVLPAQQVSTTQAAPQPGRLISMALRAPASAPFRQVLCCSAVLMAGLAARGHLTGQRHLWALPGIARL